MNEPKGIREYHRIRRFLEEIYLYGFLSREDFQKTSIGGVKDYDYGVSLLRTLYPKLDEDAIWQNGKKYLRFQREYKKSGENRLTDSYLLYALKHKEMIHILCILSACAKRPQSLDELCIAVELLGQEEGSVYATIRRRVLELEQYGYLTREKKTVRLSENLLLGLKDETLMELWEYIRFSTCVTYPRVAGSFLYRTIQRELERRNLNSQQESPFLLRSNIKRSIFDEDIVYQLLTAQKQHRKVELDLGNRQVATIPITLRIDTRLGRWYLLSMEGKPTFRRLRSIHKVKLKEVLPEQNWKDAQERVLKRYAYTGCSGRYSKKKKPVLVEVELNFASAQGLQTQFVREICMGKVLYKNGKGYYQVSLCDPEELLPVLRSYAPWIRVLPGEHQLDVLLKEHLQQMERKLEKEGVD